LVPLTVLLDGCGKGLQDAGEAHGGFYRES
jgi:hypothetical protein